MSIFSGKSFKKWASRATGFQVAENIAKARTPSQFMKASLGDAAAHHFGSMQLRGDARLAKREAKSAWASLMPEIPTGEPTAAEQMQANQALLAAQEEENARRRARMLGRAMLMAPGRQSGRVLGV